MKPNFAIQIRKIRAALTPRSSLLRCRLDNGVIVAGPNKPGFGGRGVYIYRDDLEVELKALCKFIEPGSVFIDIGANVGVYTLKAAREIGDTGTVIAVEPFIPTCAQLAANVQKNLLSNVRIRNLCVADTTGHRKFYLNSNKPNSFALIQRDEAATTTVLCASLDDLCSWEKIERLDYLKIDAEGAESMIMLGGAKTIERYRPIIQVETTLGDCPIPKRYKCFLSSRINCLYIPEENKKAIQSAFSIGWQEQNIDHDLQFHSKSR